MILDGDIMPVGQFIKPHGIKGEISASFIYDIDILENDVPVICRIDGIFVPFFIESARVKSGSTYLLKIDGIDDEKAAKMMANRQIYMRKSDVGEADFEFSDSLIGYDIYTGGKHIGHIVDIDDSTENVLFVVENKKNEILYIPVAEEFVVGLDDSDKKIEMELPDGLLDL